MVLLNISLLQFYIGKRIDELVNSSSLAGMKYSFLPTTMPSPKVFSHVPDAETYVKFIQSCFRFQLVHDCGSVYTYYFLFRNGRADDSSYTRPSSIEIISVSQGVCCVEYKKRYLLDDNHDGILNLSSLDFNTNEEMKAYLQTIGDTIVSDFRQVLSRKGCL